MTQQGNWQHMIAILFWQALMLGTLIAGAMWVKDDAAATTQPIEPSVAVVADCDPASPSVIKTRRASSRLLDIGLGI